MTPMDYLVEVAWLKSTYGEEDNVIAEQFRLIAEQLRIKKQERITQNMKSTLSSSPQVLDHQEKPILDFFIPRRKRTMRREVIQQSFCNGNESMIKKAVENSFEDEQHRVIKVNPDVGVRNQEFFRHGNRSDDRENRVFRINSKGSDVIRKRLANDPPLGFNNQERKKMKRNIAVRAEVPAPVEFINRELDIEFKNLITSNGGSLESVKLVIEKRLFQTDVKPAEGRFSIPQKKMINSFLELEEDMRLSTRNGGKMNEMRVMLIEPSRRVSEINLRKWFMKKANGNTSLSYVLVTYWNEVVRRNGLESGTEVQLWAFRKSTDLGFALVKLQD